MSLVALLLSSSALAANFTFSTLRSIDVGYPSLTTWNPTDINDHGVVVGSTANYFYSNPFYWFPDGQLDNDPPRSYIGFLDGLNNSGVVAGYTVVVNCGWRGACGSYTLGSLFTGYEKITSEGWPLADINDHNHVVGSSNGISFINNGEVMAFTVDGRPTTVTSINNLDQSTGFFITEGGESRGFVRDTSGHIVTFDGGTEFRSIRPEGINDAGLIAGTAWNGTTQVGFVGTPGNVTTLAIPGANSLIVEGINNRNEIVGAYNDESYKRHLFVIVATPVQSSVPEPGSFILAASGVLVSICRKLHRPS